MVLEKMEQTFVLLTNLGLEVYAYIPNIYLNESRIVDSVHCVICVSPAPNIFILYFMLRQVEKTHGTIASILSPAPTAEISNQS